jgi:hypothetical protein
MIPVNKTVAIGALKALVEWLRNVRNRLGRWLTRGARAAKRKEKQRRETDKRLRREDRENIEPDRS